MENLSRRNLEAKLDIQYLHGKVTFHIPRMHKDQNLSSPPLSQILQGIEYMNKLEPSKKQNLCSTERPCTVCIQSSAKVISGTGHGSPLEQIRL